MCICRDENCLKDSKNKEDDELKVWSRLVDKIENRIREGKSLKFIRCDLPEFDLPSKNCSIYRFLGSCLMERVNFYETKIIKAPICQPMISGNTSGAKGTLCFNIF